MARIPQIRVNLQILGRSIREFPINLKKALINTRKKRPLSQKKVKVPILEEKFPSDLYGALALFFVEDAVPRVDIFLCFCKQFRGVPFNEYGFDHVIFCDAIDNILVFRPHDFSKDRMFSVEPEV